MLSRLAHHFPARPWRNAAVMLWLVAGLASGGAGVTNAQQNSLPFPDDPLIQVIDPSPNATLPVDRDFVIRVTSMDRNADADEVPGVDRVELYLDGERGFPGARLLGQAALEPTTGTPEWRLSVRPIEFDDGSHVLIVYSRSTITGNETITTIPFQVSNPAA